MLASKGREVMTGSDPRPRGRGSSRQPSARRAGDSQARPSENARIQLRTDRADVGIQPPGQLVLDPQRQLRGRALRLVVGPESGDDSDELQVLALVQLSRRTLVAPKARRWSSIHPTA